jgi:hypothetical protein
LKEFNNNVEDEEEKISKEFKELVRKRKNLKEKI